MIDTLKIDIQRVKESRRAQVDFNNIPFGKVYSDHMFVADYDGKEWTNLKIVPYDYIKISPANPTLHYGQSVFEGQKAYKNDKDEVLLFRADANYARLNISAHRMCIPDVPEELYFSALTELLKLDEDWIPNIPSTSLYIRPFIFANDEYVGIRPSTTYKFMIITCPVGVYYSGAVRVKIETKYTRAVAGGTGYAKAAGNYAGSLYPAKLAAEKGYDQLVWTDGKTHEYIEESGTMNIVFRVGDKIITPETSDSILNGITRNSVLTLARDWGYEVEERRVSVKEIIEAAQSGELKEAFGVGTAATIAPIKCIGHEGLDYDLPGEEERTFSKRVLKELDDIRYGKIADRFNWIKKL